MQPALKLYRMPAELDWEAVPQHHTPVAKEYPVCFHCLFSKYSVRGVSITVINHGFKYSYFKFNVHISGRVKVGESRQKRSWGGGGGAGNHVIVGFQFKKVCVLSKSIGTLRSNDATAMRTSLKR